MSLYFFVRSSFFGTTCNYVSGYRFFTYEEEEEEEDHYMISQGKQVLVKWDGNDDQENPKNWPLWMKTIFSVQIAFLTTSVYMASAIYTPGIEQLIEDFEISRLKATLPLTMFVIGYGIGPMFFSPLSENIFFGRTSIYIFTLFIFCILQIPIALANNIVSLTILRFLSGFFGSPALATGGASVADICSPAYVPLVIAAWSIGGVSGPSIGPLFGAIMTEKQNWRWTFWFVCIVSGVCLVLISVFLPETHEKTLLHRKAERLRKLTGNPCITSEGELETKGKKVREILTSTLWRPIEISLFEPIVFCIDLYIALVYSVLYLWFEAFPIVYLDIYQFKLIPFGATFLSIIVGVFIGSSAYILYLYKMYTKRVLKGFTINPEFFLPIMIVAAVFMPVGIFIFGWTSSSRFFWFGSLFGSSLFGMGFFIIFQTGFNYLSSSFIDYIASVFAGNNFFRSIIAGCFPLFANSLFGNLSSKNFPVAWGCSILGFIAVAMIIIPVIFYLFGPKMRAKSKYSTFVLDS